MQIVSDTLEQLHVEMPTKETAESVHIDFWVRDRELVLFLLEHPEGRERDEFARTALKIGVLALRQAQVRIDADSVRREGEHLIAALANRLDTFQTQVGGMLSSTLRDYLDPKDGRFSERVERLIRDGGDIEKVILTQTENARVALQNSLEAYLGADSPIIRMLTPDESNALIAVMQSTINDLVTGHLRQILFEFSLDNRHGALARLIDELTVRNGQLAGDLKANLLAVAEEFSLSKDDSALSTLIRRVEEAHKRIAAEFTLDDKSSALSRLNAELKEIISTHKTDSTIFQQKIIAMLEAMKARKEERQAGTQHGKDFEQAAYAVVESLCQKAGDIAEYVANQVGLIRSSKTGDAVIILGPDCQASGTRIVCEMKEDSSYTLKKALMEIEQARSNRNAQVGLFIFSRRTAPATLSPLARYGMDIVALWDAEDETTDVYLSAGLMIAKAIAVNSRNLRPEIEADFTAMDKAIREIQRQTESLDEIDRSSNTIKNGAEKILSRVESMRKALERQVDILSEQIERVKSVRGDDQTE